GAARLAGDPDSALGRPDALDALGAVAWGAGEPGALDELALRYDQAVPDPGAASKLRQLATWEGPLIGFFGKIIPQKGVNLLVEALGRLPSSVRCVIAGFGLHREHIAALVEARGL